MFFSRSFWCCNAALFFLTACASSSSAPDFPHAWRPLNDLPDQVVEIPLTKQHVYQVTQLDTTVKGLLERWGEEAKIPVVYDHSSDFTLFKGTKKIQALSLQEALSELTEMYADHNIVFYLNNNIIMAHKKAVAVMETESKSKSKSKRK